jgi:hypothetical protein
MVITVNPSLGLAYASGLFGLAIAWLLTSGMAFVSDKQWMVRSYFVTFAFVIIRVITALMTYYGIGRAGIGQDKDPFALASWACWAVPLLLTELVIQGKQVFAGGTRSAA